MSDVATGHQQVVVPDDGVAPTMAGPQVNSNALTDRVSVTDKAPAVFSFEFFVLGVGPDDRSRVDLVVLSKNGIGKEGYVIVQLAPIADPAVGPYIGEGPDRDIVAYLCGRVNNDMFVVDRIISLFSR